MRFEKWCLGTPRKCKFCWLQTRFAAGCLCVSEWHKVPAIRCPNFGPHTFNLKSNSCQGTNGWEEIGGSAVWDCGQVVVAPNASEVHEKEVKEPNFVAEIGLAWQRNRLAAFQMSGLNLECQPMFWFIRSVCWVLNI